MTKFLRRILAFAGLVVLSSTALAGDWRMDLLNQDRCLTLYRQASKETANFCYWRKGQGLDQTGYQKANYILRDVEYRYMGQMDVRLLDVLFLIQQWLRQEGRRSDIHILSGIRTPAHNAVLEGAAKNSEHMHGKAADIFIPGLKTNLLAVMTRIIGVGGVGIYPVKNFVHVDTGNVRVWVYR
ncbi:YcbK family protein [Pseudomonas aeruginosa]